MIRKWLGSLLSLCPRWSRRFYRASCNTRKDMGSPLWPRVKMQSRHWKHSGLAILRKLLGFIQQGRWWPQSIWDSQGVIMIDSLEKGKRANWAGFARKLTRGILLLQEHATSCHDCCDWMWTWNPSSSPIFSWYGSFWLLSVPKTEIPSSWFTVWKQLRCHRGSQRVYGDQEKVCYFEGIRKLEQRWTKCITLKGDYIEKYWSKFHSLVARSASVREHFYHPSYIFMQITHQFFISCWNTSGTRPILLEN